MEQIPNVKGRNLVLRKPTFCIKDLNLSPSGNASTDSGR
jgi:hypothetical protein